MKPVSIFQVISSTNCFNVAVESSEICSVLVMIPKIDMM